MAGMKTKNVFYNQVKKCWEVQFTNGISNRASYYRQFETEDQARDFAKSPRLFCDGTDRNF